MSHTNPKRRLLKFSLYSTAVVLPKKLLAELGWEAGDKVSISTDQSKKQLLIRHPKNYGAPKLITPKPAILRDNSPPSKPAKITTPSKDDEMLPIPEID